MDNVSVNHTNASTNVFINDGFETGDFTGWTQYRATNANCGGSGSSGQITNSTCYSGTYCYVDKCNLGSHADYLIQSFPTVAGDYYVISFYLRTYATGGGWFVYVMLT